MTATSSCFRPAMINFLTRERTSFASPSLHLLLETLVNWEQWLSCSSHPGALQVSMSRIGVVVISFFTTASMSHKRWFLTESWAINWPSYIASEAQSMIDRFIRYCTVRSRVTLSPYKSTTLSMRDVSSGDASGWRTVGGSCLWSPAKINFGERRMPK